MIASGSRRFNGATTGEPWKTRAIADCMRSSGLMLQWGHDAGAWKTWLTQYEIALASSLQWGHDMVSRGRPGGPFPACPAG